jgi:CheY-like chemotaxis protein
MTTKTALNILVADDNQDSVGLIKAMLEASGHTVHTAYNGTDAIQLARAQQPDVAILDLGMPGMSGNDVAKAIRLEPWGGDPLLIALTGWGTAEDKLETSWAGFDEHLTKPVSIHRIEQLIAEELES